MNPFAGIYSSGQSTNDISMSDLEGGGKMSGYFSTGSVLGNMDAQNTAQRGKKNASSMQDAHKEVMDAFGEGKAFGIELETGAPIEKSIGLKGTTFGVKQGPLDPNREYFAGGKFRASQSGYALDATSELVRKFNTGELAMPTLDGEKGYRGVRNYFAPSKESEQRNIELGGSSQGVYNPNRK